MQSANSAKLINISCYFDSSGLLQHLSIENFHSQNGKKVPIEKETYFEELKVLLELLKLFIEENLPDDDDDALKSLLTIIHCSVKRCFPELIDPDSRQVFEGLESHLWSLIKSHHSELVADALSEVLLRINVSDQTVSHVITSLIGSGDDKNRQKVLDNLLQFFQSEIDNPDSPLDILDVQPFNYHLFKIMLNDETMLVVKAMEISTQDLVDLSTSYPKVSVILKYFTTLLSKLCSKLTFKKDAAAEKVFLEYFVIILKHSNALMETILKTSLVIRKNYDLDSKEFTIRRKFITLCFKSSILGTILPMMLTIHGGMFQQDASVKTTNLLLKLATHCSHIAEIFDTDSQVFDQLESFPPWSRTTKIETPHPLPEGFKMTETIKVSGANKVIIFFDPLCSTLNDYDKLVLSSPTNKRIAEFGGNIYGQGNKRTLSGGWPKNPIAIDGDTITLNFELKSR